MAARRRKTTRNESHVGEVFARRLREARDARGWTQQELSAELGRLGAPMDRTTVAKIEKGQRQARVEELVAFAAALDVSPAFLLLPLRLDTTVALTPKMTVETVTALRWACGEGPLDSANERFYRFQAPTVQWAVWPAGRPDEAKGGGGLTEDQVRAIARQLDELKKGEHDG
jgi:transcriptional regulator with XRE-family HTH domain